MYSSDDSILCIECSDDSEVLTTAYIDPPHSVLGCPALNDPFIQYH